MYSQSCVFVSICTSFFMPVRACGKFNKVNVGQRVGGPIDWGLVTVSPQCPTEVRTLIYCLRGMLRATRFENTL